MGKISNQHLIEKLTAKYGEQISAVSEPYGLLTFEATRTVISDLLAFLKNDKELKFNYLTDITAIHYPEKENALGVIYHLHSFYNNVRIRIKVFIPVSDPTIPTATVLWEGANWMERETFDFFGIQFTRHPDLRRILNVDDMTVFPMRREYPLEDPNRVDKKDYFFGR